MKFTNQETMDDATLLAQAQASAERWERLVLAGAAHKGSDRPERSRKRKGSRGPARRGQYEFAPMNGDLWYIVVDGKRHKVASFPVPASWYGDDYGTGRHYAHIAEQEYAFKAERGMGRTARTGKCYRINPVTGERTALGGKRGPKYGMRGTFVPYSADTAALFADGTSGHVGMQSAS